MAISDSFLPEFDNETATTRRVLERIPNDRADWRPHPKSWTVGELGLHIANLLSWTGFTINGSEFDTNPPDGSGPPKVAFESTAAILETFDKNVAEARAMIAGASDADLMAPWTLKSGGQPIFTLPKVAVLRSFVFNHEVHHRGQLTVYLRLMDIPLPSVYGPTADEPGN